MACTIHRYHCSASSQCNISLTLASLLSTISLYPNPITTLYDESLITFRTKQALVLADCRSLRSIKVSNDESTASREPQEQALRRPPRRERLRDLVKDAGTLWYQRKCMG
jgi:hypothetical protein